MNLYLAGTALKIRYFSKREVSSLLRNAYLLESYFYVSKNPEAFELLISNGANILLDSGAFSFMNGAKDVDWWEYLTQYATFINRHGIDLFLELDLDSIVGLKETEKMRAELERLTNKKCIPVWHISRGIEYWKDMCKNYDYIAFGGLMTDGITRAKVEKLFPWFLSYAHKNNCKVHGLGYTSIGGIKKYKFDSVDSSTWINGSRFGEYHHFNGNSIVKLRIPQKYSGHKAKGAELDPHNFEEWIKFQKYMLNYVSY